MIWFTLALLVAGFFVQAFFAPKPALENARPGRLADIKFPIASEGSPVPVIYGRIRLRSPNCIWYGSFKTRARTKKVKTGTFSSDHIITGYSYYVGFDMALCTGPGVILKKVWSGKKILYQSGVGVGPAPTQISIDKGLIYGGSARGGGFKGTATFYGGQDSQAINTYLEDELGPDIPGYAGMSHIVFERPYIGTSPMLRPMSFELERYPDNLGLFSLGFQLIGADLNPMEILYSLLVETWGGVGVDPSNIDTASFIAAAETLYDESNGMSLVVSSPNQAQNIVEEVLRQVDGILYQDASTGKITAYLIREDYIIGNLPVFDDSNIVEVRDFTRTSWPETYNQVRTKFTYRDKKYEDGTAFAQDMANINTQGKIRSVTLSFPGCTEGALAVALATRELSQRSVPLYKAILGSNRDASALHPGSPFLWSHVEYGLTAVVMRIKRFDLGTLSNGAIGMETLQDKFAAANTLYTNPEDTLWEEVDRTAVPITEFLLFEAPYWVLNRLEDFTVEPDSSYLWAPARRPAEMQTYDFVASVDNFVLDTTVEVEQQEFPPSARLVGSLFKKMGQIDGVIDKITIDEFDLDPNDFGGFWEEPSPLITTDANGIRTEGINLMIINGEIIAFETYTDIGNGLYELEDVHRALLDTQYEDHIDNDVVYFLNSINLLSRNPRQDLDTLWYKFLSYSDQDGQDILDVVSQVFTTNQRYDKPLPPDRIEIDVPAGGGLRCPIELTEVSSIDVTDWLERNRVTPDQVVLVPDSTDTPESSTTYNVRFLLDSVLQDQSVGTTLSAVPITLNAIGRRGTGRIELESERNALTSWTEDFVEFYFAYYQNLTSELVVNGDFESSLTTGWTEDDGDFDREVTGYPLNTIPPGDRHVETKDAGNNELSQSVDVTSYPGQAAIFRIWRGSLNTGVQSQIKLDLIELPSTTLDSITTPLYEVPVGKWEMIEIPVPISTSTDDVKITLISDGIGAAFDNVTLKANTASPTTATQYNLVAGVTVVGAWGLRQMVSTYAGALIRIRDTEDDSEADIGFDEDGNLEMYHTVGEARVVSIYDQSGNGADIEAASASEQPQLKHMLSETGRPTIDFAGGTEALLDTVASTTRPYMVTRPNCCFAVGPKADTSSDYIATIPHDDAGHTTPFFRWGMTTGATNWIIGVNASIGGVAGNGPSNGPQKNVWFLDYQQGFGYHNDDVASIASWTAADITYPNNTRLRLAENSIGSSKWDGDFHELCIFTGTISAGNRQTIMESVADYWFALAV